MCRRIRWSNEVRSAKEIKLPIDGNKDVYPDDITR
jgi:hypothetical protein